MTPINESASARVVRNDDASQFELHVEGDVVSHADFRLDGNVVIVTHVETPPAHRGQGYAAQLMKGLLEHLELDGQTIRPLCPYAASYVRDRPDVQHLVAQPR